MPSVTLKKACELTGKSKRTIQRYMSNGKLSCAINKDGHKAVEISELIRVFGGLSPLSPLEPEKSSPAVTPGLSPLNSSDVAVQIAQAITAAQAPLLDKISDLISQVENLTNRLEHNPIEPRPEPKVKAKPKPKAEPRYPDKPKSNSHYFDIPVFGKN